MLLPRLIEVVQGLTFVRTTLLKAPTPVKKDAAGAKKDGPSEGFQAQLSKRIQSWVKRNYEAAVRRPRDHAAHQNLTDDWGETDEDSRHD